MTLLGWLGRKTSTQKFSGSRINTFIVIVEEEIVVVVVVAAVAVTVVVL